MKKDLIKKFLEIQYNNIFSVNYLVYDHGFQDKSKFQYFFFTTLGSCFLCLFALANASSEMLNRSGHSKHAFVLFPIIPMTLSLDFVICVIYQVKVIKFLPRYLQIESANFKNK